MKKVLVAGFLIFFALVGYGYVKVKNPFPQDNGYMF